MLEFLGINKEFFISCIAIIVSSISLILTRQQIKLSNKQNLFDRRLKNYMFCRSLINNYRLNRGKIKQNKTNIAVNYYSIIENMIILCGCRVLDDACLIVSGPTNLDLEKKFGENMENLKLVGMETTFIFPKQESDLLKYFIDAYIELLLQIYKYMLSVLKSCHGITNDDLNILTQYLRIEDRNRQLCFLLKAYENLEKAYVELEKNKVEEEIEKIIKLN